MAGARRAFLAAIALAASLTLTGCDGGTSWHRKLTIVVGTPDGAEIIGSAVQYESIAEKGGWWAPPEARGAARSLSGEAVVIQIAEGRYLFALIGKPDTFVVMTPGQAPLEIASKLAAMRGAKDVPKSEYPMLVTFRDIDDPKGVMEVKPEKLSDTFGAGHHLKSITLEITNEPVTEGKVGPLLAWLSDYPEPALCERSDSSQISFCRTVHHGDIIRR